jgi:hypothetical protein
MPLYFPTSFLPFSLLSDASFLFQLPPTPLLCDAKFLSSFIHPLSLLYNASFLSFPPSFLLPLRHLIPFHLPLSPVPFLPRSSPSVSSAVPHFFPALLSPSLHCNPSFPSFPFSDTSFKSFLSYLPQSSLFPLFCPFTFLYSAPFLSSNLPSSFPLLCPFPFLSPIPKPLLLKALQSGSALLLCYQKLFSTELSQCVVYLRKLLKATTVPAFCKCAACKLLKAQRIFLNLRAGRT